jgi:hypothetical protein
MVTINGIKRKKWETLCKECGGEKVFTKGYRGTYCTCKDVDKVDPKEWKNANEGVLGVTIIEYINKETGESRIETSNDVE